MSGFYASPRVRVLASSAVAVNAPADTAENILATVVIPASAMGPNGILRVSSFWSCTSSTNAKTLRHRLGGIGGTAFGVMGPSTATAVVSPYIVSTIMNRSSEAAQVANSIANRVNDLLAGGSLVNGTINTATAQNLVLTAQKGLGSETITLEGYLVELITP